MEILLLFYFTPSPLSLVITLVHNTEKKCQFFYVEQTVYFFVYNLNDLLSFIMYSITNFCFINLTSVLYILND